MRSRRALVSALGVGVVAAGLIAVLGLRAAGRFAVTTTSLGGRRAPAIVGRELVGARTVSLRALRGRYVVVDFFASWCGACLAEEPEIEAFTYQHRHDPSVGFIGVDIEDSPAAARAFLVHYGATWPAVVDRGGSIAQSYGVASPPELFLVDPKGRIVSSISQAVTAAELSSWVREARAAGA